MSTSGESRLIVHDFAKKLQKVITMADDAQIQELCELIDQNKQNLAEEFLRARMHQAKAVDEVLGKMI